MNLQCGHEASCELDTICPICGRSFIAKPFIYFGIAVLLTLFIYYSEYLTRFNSYYNNLIILFISFVVLLEIIILRNKGTELFINLFLVLPILLISFEPVVRYYSGTSTEIVIYIIYFIFSIPILLTIFLGFKDAAFYDNLNSGSLWVIVSFFLSLTISILYWIYPVILEINPYHQIDSILDKVNYYLQLVYNFRLALVTVILGLVTLFSISTSLRKELEVRKIKITNPSAEEDATFLQTIFIGLSRFFTNMGEAILTGFDLGKQILAIVFIEVFQLIKHSIIRTILIVVRMIRVIILSIITFLLGIVINKITSLIVVLWNSFSFWSMSFINWLLFLCYCLCFIVLLWLLTFFSYKKWLDFPQYPLGFKRMFLTFFGSKKEALIAHRSIMLSAFMFVFYLGLVFLGAWLIINPAHLILALNKPNPFGFLFLFTVIIMTFAGIAKIIIKK